MTNKVLYSDYLKLGNILNSQNLESKKHGDEAHDEMLFIVVHQVFELWFKQILYELNSVTKLFQQEYVDETNMAEIVGKLRRITEIQRVLLEHFTILETMTPLDFLDFRSYIVPASGFQSLQFRLIENKLGLEPSKRIKYFEEHYSESLPKDQQDIIKNSEEEPSLFELIEKWLERTPFLNFSDFNFLDLYKKAVENMINSEKELIRNNPTLSDDQKQINLAEHIKTRQYFNSMFKEEIHNEMIQKGEKRLSYKATQAALLISLYRDQPILQLPFRLITVLVDIDELFSAWRYKHSVLVHRMIGAKVGTGGSAGFNYLKVTVESHKVFNDFFGLSTYLIPRSSLPKLPEKVKENLGFIFRKKAM